MEVEIFYFLALFQASTNKGNHQNPTRPYTINKVRKLNSSESFNIKQLPTHKAHILQTIKLQFYILETQSFDTADFSFGLASLVSNPESAPSHYEQKSRSINKRKNENYVWSRNATVVVPQMMKVGWIQWVSSVSDWIETEGNWRVLWWRKNRVKRNLKKVRDNKQGNESGRKEVGFWVLQEEISLLL